MAKNFDKYLKDALASIKLIVLDVDGVMTDGKNYYTANGEYMKSFNTKDGASIKHLKELGYTFAIITGSNSDIIDRRMEVLGIQHVFKNVKDKLTVFKKLIKTLGINCENVAYMGDDLIDLPVLKCVKIASCPNDAVQEVKDVCNFFAKNNGGYGAVRELCDAILAAKH